MKRLILGFLSLLTVGQLAFVALPAAAQNCDPASGNAIGCLEATNLGNGQGAAAAGNQLPVLIGRLIRILLGLLGIIFLVLIVYAGFLWMTARGDSDAVDKAKDIIRNSIIGLIIIFVAYALTGFIFSALIRATTGNAV